MMNLADDSPRIRIRIACDECRRGKRKCDGRKPRCTLCARSDRVCHYAPEESRKRKNYDEDLVRSLQDEVMILRAALSKKNDADAASEVNESKPKHRVEAQAFNSVDYSSIGDSDQSTPITEEQAIESRSPQAMNELSSLMLQLDIADMGEPSFTIASSQVPRNDIQEHPKTSFTSRFRPDSNESHHLSIEDRRHLVQCFSDQFNRYHQFLDAEECTALALLPSEPDEIDLEFRNAALLAVAASCSETPRRGALVKHYSTSAERLALRSIKERPSDLVVQGCALLAWTELMFGSAGMAYNWTAMATGQVLQLGLHTSSLKSVRSPESQDEPLYRRRVRSFWAYFSVDRLVTSSLGMNCTIHWQRVKPWPFTSILSAQPSVDEWSHQRFCELWHLWDSCMDQGYAFGWSKLSETERENLVLHSHQTLTKFYKENSAPLHIQRDHMSETVVWVQLSYHAALILIHRPLLNESSDSKMGKFSLRVATTAAASISRIVREYSKTKTLTAIAPQIIDYISTAAIIHLLNATSGKNRLGRQSANGIRTCIEAISGMITKWGHRARDSVTRIQDLAHRWEVVWALPIQFTQPLQPQVPTHHTREIDQGVEIGTRSAMNVYDVFHDTNLDNAAQRLWDPQEGVLDQDFILNAVEGVEDNDVDIWNLGWLFDGDRDGMWSFPR